MATAAPTFKRQILEDSNLDRSVESLQGVLVHLVDLALLLKQAHWNVVGPNFRSVHLQLDEIIEAVRAGSDEVAERIVTLGRPADGRARIVAEKSTLKDYSDDFVGVSSTVAAVADALKTTIGQMRDAIEVLGETDPVSEDLCIAAVAPLEKFMWMVQAQEVN